MLFVSRFGYTVHMKHRKLFITIGALLVIMIGVCVGYTQYYYHADLDAASALESDSSLASRASVTVSKTDYGWFFDGPSEENALIFYPGGKVEETAYAPLLHRLAADGIDVCLVKMPARLAVLDGDKADDVISQYSYEHWFIGGHSLGGAMAANYLADPDSTESASEIEGLVLLAAYPSKPLRDPLRTLTIYGSKDGVLNMQKYTEGMALLSSEPTEHIIKGGNHAQFGNYGVQKGDGKASISSDEQQQETIDAIIDWIK